jgi:hypothetical protein
MRKKSTVNSQQSKVKVLRSGRLRITANTTLLFEAVQNQLVQHLNLFKENKTKSDLMLNATYWQMHDWFLRQNWLGNKDGKFLLRRGEAFAMVVILIPYQASDLIELKAALLKAL